MTIGKTIALTLCTSVSKVMSLLFNMLSRLIVAFLPRSKRLLISWLHSLSSVILEPKKTKIMASGPITSWQIDGETVETVIDFFGGAPESLQMVIAAMKLKDAYSLEGKL